MYTIKVFNNTALVKEIKFNYIADVVNYYLNSIDTIKVFDANGTEIPEDMLPF